MNHDFSKKGYLDTPSGKDYGVSYSQKNDNFVLEKCTSANWPVCTIKAADLHLHQREVVGCRLAPLVGLAINLGWARGSLNMIGSHHLHAIY